MVIKLNNLNTPRGLRKGHRLGESEGLKGPEKAGAGGKGVGEKGGGGSTGNYPKHYLNRHFGVQY